MDSRITINAPLLCGLLLSQLLFLSGCLSSKAPSEVETQNDTVAPVDRVLADSETAHPRFFNGFYRSGINSENFSSKVLETGTVKFDKELFQIEDSFAYSGGGSNEIVYSHDKLGRLVIRDSLHGGTRTYEYNRKGLPASELRQYTDGRSRKREFKWNLEGYLYQSTYYYYSAADALTQIIQYNYQYDNNSRLVSRDCKNIRPGAALCLAAQYKVDDDNRVTERILTELSTNCLLYTSPSPRDS